MFTNTNNELKRGVNKKRKETLPAQSLKFFLGQINKDKQFDEPSNRSLVIKIREVVLRNHQPP